MDRTAAAAEAASAGAPHRHGVQREDDREPGGGCKGDDGGDGRLFSMNGDGGSHPTTAAPGTGDCAGRKPTGAPYRP